MIIVLTYCLKSGDSSAPKNPLCEKQNLSPACNGALTTICLDSIDCLSPPILVMGVTLLFSSLGSLQYFEMLDKINYSYSFRWSQKKSFFSFDKINNIAINKVCSFAIKIHRRCVITSVFPERMSWISFNGFLL